MPFRLLYISILAITLFQATTKITQAHGGTIIDSDITNGYEWLMAVNPYPMTPGEVSLALLVYDAETYDPMNDLQVELYLAAPSNPNPCCNVEQHIGPIALEILPDIYPGDYSTFINLEEVGEWVAKYVVTTDNQSPLELIIPFDVRPLDLDQPRPTLEKDSVVPYSQPTLIDEEVSEPPLNRQPTSTPTSEPSLLSNISILFANNLWLWGLVAMIPIGMIVMVLVFSSNEEDDNQPTDEIEE